MSLNRVSLKDNLGYFQQWYFDEKNCENCCFSAIIYKKLSSKSKQIKNYLKKSLFYIAK